MLLLILSLLIFGFYFYLIDALRLSFLPFIVIIILFFYYFKIFNNKKALVDFIIKHSLIISSALIAFGIAGILYISGFKLIEIFLTLMGLSMILTTISYLINYKDGKFLGRSGFILTTISILLLFIFKYKDFNLQSFAYINTIIFAFLTFLLFPIRPFRKGEHGNLLKILRSTSFITLIGLVIAKYFGLQRMAFFDFIATSGLIYLFYFYTANFSLISDTKGLSPQNLKSDKAKENLKNLLKGGIEISQSNNKFSGVMAVLKKLNLELKDGEKFVIPVLNIFFIGLAIGIFLLTMPAKSILFWLGIFVTLVIYVGNIRFLEKIGLKLKIENLFLLSLIDFFVYYGLFNFFVDAKLQTLLGILWGSLWFYELFNLDKIKFLKFSKVDFVWAVIIGLINVVLNLYFLSRIDYNGEILFFLGMIYIGSVILVLKYLREEG